MRLTLRVSDEVDPGVATEEPALGMKLTGDPHPLDRLVSVQPNTVVVVFEQDSVPRLKFPGEYLTPGLLPSLHSGGCLRSQVHG